MFIVGQLVKVTGSFFGATVVNGAGEDIVGETFNIVSIEGGFENIAKGVLDDGRAIQIEFKHLEDAS